MDDVQARAAPVRLAVFDVDGVLTDGGLLLGPGGQEFKIFHVHDGLGLVMLRRQGLDVAVISARESGVVAERMAALGITHVQQGRNDKREALVALMQDIGVEARQTAYVGDDLIDLPAMSVAGFAVAVADAHPLVRERAHWVTARPGGRGAAREVCELLLRAQGLFNTAIDEYVRC
jgi:3-deoxy-D-manno-octulosonate 8-phosphate phosphatase (KDO 8-P phosphatase)